MDSRSKEHADLISELLGCVDFDLSRFESEGNEDVDLE